jgi:hypothetical protein
MSERVWLFVRAYASIRIARREDPPELAVYGPGRRRANYSARDRDELDRFQGVFERRLLQDGWTFEGSQAERRSGSERRTTTRGRDRRRRDPP